MGRKEIMRLTIQFMDDFTRYFPSIMKNKTRRKYCLLGQHFLRNVGSIQLNDIMIFIDKQTLGNKLFPPGE